ncbi:OmpA family protein [Thalassospiraceae bacterium LMO-JJ14]|nr:OmpA family protein [Thalassospiraceae bacterium LMO-JJ14]
MKSIKYLSVIALASVLGACAAPTPQDLNVSQVRGLQDKGNEFHAALHRDYTALAQSELDEADRGDTDYFNTKARQAAANGNVLPTRMDERSIPSAYVNELAQARGNLMRALDAGAATRAPLPSARAQTQFDCWMQEQEENYQPDDIAACRKGFLTALNQTNAILAAVVKPMVQPKAAAAPAPAPKPLIEIATYTIYFDHNSSSLNSKALAMNNEIIAAIKNTKATSVTVNGYTDRSGTNAYNRQLAERRTATVTDAIVASGIKPKVGYQSFGETRSAVKTADDTQNWANRRVVVILQK